MKILLILLILVCLILLFFACGVGQQKTFPIDKIAKNVEKYNDNVEDLKDLIEKYKNIKDDDEWWKPCQECHFFEGYDICTRNGNFGVVTDVSKARCEKYNLFQKK